MTENNNYNVESQFESSMLSFDDDMDADIKIKPSYYIHNGLVMAQRTLMIGVLKANVKDALISYKILVENIEMLCKSANYLKEDYDKAINEYILTDDYTKTNDTFMQMTKLSHKKLFYLMKEVFSRTALTNPLGLKTPKGMIDLKDKETPQAEQS